MRDARTAVQRAARRSSSTKRIRVSRRTSRGKALRSMNAGRQRRPVAVDGDRDGQVIRPGIAEERAPGDDHVVENHRAVISRVDAGKVIVLRPQDRRDVFPAGKVRQRVEADALRKRVLRQPEVARAGPQAFHPAPVPCRAMGSGEPHQERLVEIRQFIGQGTASHGPGHGHDGCDPRTDLGIGDQGLQDVRGPLGVADEDGFLAGLEGRREKMVPDQACVAGAAGPALDGYAARLEPDGFQVGKGVGEHGDHRIEAVVEEPGHHQHPQVELRFSQLDGPSRGRGLSGELPEGLVAGPVIGKRPAVILADGAVDLPEAPARIGRCRVRYRRQDEGHGVGNRRQDGFAAAGRHEENERDGQQGPEKAHGRVPRMVFSAFPRDFLTGAPTDVNMAEAPPAPLRKCGP